MHNVSLTIARTRNVANALKPLIAPRAIRAIQQPACAWSAVLALVSSRGVMTPVLAVMINYQMERPASTIINAAAFGVINAKDNHFRVAQR